jgi:hypothetical protein
MVSLGPSFDTHKNYGMNLTELVVALQGSKTYNI